MSGPCFIPLFDTEKKFSVFSPIFRQIPRIAFGILMGKEGVFVEAAQILSKNIIAFRTVRSQSQVDFSKEVGIAKSTLQGIEKGHSPNLDTIELIAKGLGVPVTVLLSDSLPSNELAIVAHLIQACAQYHRWSREDRQSMLCAACEIARLLDKYAC